jgi:hypothetical protein
MEGGKPRCFAGRPAPGGSNMAISRRPEAARAAVDQDDDTTAVAELGVDR